MADSMIQGVVDWVKTCPLMKGGAYRVDILGPKPVEYSIEPLSADRIVQEYIDGSSIRQYVFAINSREFFSVDLLQNVRNSAFYEALADWFEEQNHKENFPKIGENKSVETVELTTPGYLFAADSKTARYQMVVRVEYFQEAKRHG